MFAPSRLTRKAISLLADSLLAATALKSRLLVSVSIVAPCNFAGQDQDISVAMNIGDVSQQVTVEANAVGSIASALAPDGRFARARSART